MPKIVLFVFLAFTAGSLKAQTWEIGGGGGGAGYMGDLNPNNPVKISGPSIGGFAGYNFSGYLSAKINYNFGTISAADSNSSSQQFRNRNLSFTTLLSEVSVTGEFNFMNYIPSVTKNKFTPYIYLGFGVLNYYPTTIYNGKKYDLRGERTEGEKPYPTMAFSFPYGAGIKYNIFGNFTIGANIGYRNPNTDYLDDVSGVYANKKIFGSPIAKALSDRSGEKTGVYIGSPGTQRGDGNPRDTYFFTQITLSYTFISQKCYFH
jgi:hypothetical protein